MKEFALFGLRAAATLLLLTLCSLLMLLAAIATLGRLRRWYSEGIATPFGRMVLRIWGIRVELSEPRPWPTEPVVYVSNHSSTIDLFALIALGLPNARFFLSGFLRGLLPMGLIGYLIGIFWTVPQEFPEKRRLIFQRAERVLRRTGESVYLSPEGQRVTSGGIGAFNKGAFHLATALQRPIVPLFIYIPRAIDPGRGLHAKPGTVQVHVGEPIETRGWRVQDVPLNRNRVRDFYVEWHHRLHAA